MESFHWSLLLGGFTFFFFGLRYARQGLQATAGDRMRLILGKLTSNRVTGLIFGALVTVMLQSSGATSVMLISFAETQLLSLTQAAAVLLGADIGTTFTVFLLSIQKITDYALIIITLGFFIQVLFPKRRARHMGGIVLGFGLIFYGMSLMSDAAAPLEQSQLAQLIFTYLADNPIATLILSTVVASVLHSAGTIGIAMALAFAGTITFKMSIPIVLGANVGTCVTAILSALGSNVHGKRVAGAHAISKIIGVAVAFPFLHQIALLVEHSAAWFGGLIPLLEPGIPGKIVITHILFNLGLAILFLPLLNILVWFVSQVLPESISKEEEFRPKYLDPSALETPALAFAQVKREIMRLAALVEDQLVHVLSMFQRGPNAEPEIERIEADDDKIDILEKAVRFYLARLSSENLSDAQADRQLALLAIGQDLEEIGDIVSREMSALARKKAERQRVFSEQGWEDLRKLQTAVLENFRLAISVLAQPSDELIAKVMRHESHMAEMEQGFRQSHLARLNQGMKESFDTSSIHLDILSNLRRINTKAAHITQMAVQL